MAHHLENPPSDHLTRETHLTGVEISEMSTVPSDDDEEVSNFTSVMNRMSTVDGSPLPKENPEVPSNNYDPESLKRLQMSFFLSLAGSEAFMFLWALTFLKMFSNLGPLAVFGIVVFSSKLAGFKIGVWAQKTNRKLVAKIGLGAQWVGIVAGLLFITAIYSHQSTNRADDAPLSVAGFITLFLLAAACGWLHGAGSIIMRAWVLEDWMAVLQGKGALDRPVGELDTVPDQSHMISTITARILVAITLSIPLTFDLYSTILPIVAVFMIFVGCADAFLVLRVYQHSPRLHLPLDVDRMAVTGVNSYMEEFHASDDIINHTDVAGIQHQSSATHALSSSPDSSWSSTWRFFRNQDLGHSSATIVFMQMTMFAPSALLIGYLRLKEVPENGIGIALAFLALVAFIVLYTSPKTIRRLVPVQYLRVCLCAHTGVTLMATLSVALHWNTVIQVLLIGLAWMWSCTVRIGHQVMLDTHLTPQSRIPMKVLLGCLEGAAVVMFYVLAMLFQTLETVTVLAAVSLLSVAVGSLMFFYKSRADTRRSPQGITPSRLHNEPQLRESV
eukprot:223550_1